MRHVNEGEIHAYLDGALDLVAGEDATAIREHLATCDDCARLMEEERGIREAAGEILRESDPVEIPLPPLEELRERALAPPAPEQEVESAPSRYARWNAWQVPLTWAATVILALGIGWRVGVQFPGTSAPTIPAAMQGLSREGSDLDALSAPEERDAPPEASDIPSQALEDESGAGVLPDDSRIQQVSEAARERAEPDPADFARGAGADVAGEREEGKRTEPAAAPAETRQVMPTMALMQRDSLIADSAMARLEFVDVSADAAEEARRGRGDLAARQMVTNVAADEELQAPVVAGVVEPSVVEGVLREGEFTESSLAVPGMPVLEVKWEEWVPGQEGFMIRQLLPTGDTLELRYLGILSGEVGGVSAPSLPREKAGEAAKAMPSPPPPMEASLPPGWNQVTVQWRNGWLVARAPLSEGSLMTLVRSIF
ncbi:hypothetical protein ACGF5M_04540 [Gemmatimonadota bacterium]